MKFRYDKHGQDLAGWALVHAITDCVVKHRATHEELIQGRREHEIEFRMNGIELDFVAVMKRLDELREEQITKLAQKLIEERFSDLLHKVYVLTDQISEELRDHTRALLGLKLSEGNA